VMEGNRVIEWTDSTGSPVTVGSETVTPHARSVIVRWPFGAAVWSGPSAVVVEGHDRTDRIDIVNLNRRILWGLRVGAVALIACIAFDRRRKDSHGG